MDSGSNDNISESSSSDSPSSSGEDEQPSPKGGTGLRGKELRSLQAQQWQREHDKKARKEKKRKS